MDGRMDGRVDVAALAADPRASDRQPLPFDLGRQDLEREVVQVFGPAIGKAGHADQQVPGRDSGSLGNHAAPLQAVLQHLEQADRFEGRVAKR